MEGIVMKEIGHSYKDSGGHSFLVLHNVNLNLAPGECVALTGESGSGKSTIARLLLGFEKPSKGELWMDGTELTHLKPAEFKLQRKKIQAVFQDTSGVLNPHRSVYRNMEEGLLNLTGFNERERKAEIEKLMEHFRLEKKLLAVPPRQLSGGEQRRVSLVRALAVRPKYLVLDEVTSGLDVISAQAVLDTLLAYRDKFGCTYLFITHDLTGACRISDRILQMKKGKLIKEGRRI